MYCDTYYSSSFLPSLILSLPVSLSLPLSLDLPPYSVKTVLQNSFLQAP